MADNLKGVPVALDIHGEIIEPQDANPEGIYICLGCGERVNLIAAHQRIMYGQVVDVSTHFSYLSGSQCSLGGEGIQHLATKLTLEQYCRENTELRFFLVCPICDKRSVKRIQRRPTEEVRVEVSVGNYRLDVAIVHSETQRVRLGFEVLYSHAVGESGLEFRRLLYRHHGDGELKGGMMQETRLVTDSSGLTRNKMNMRVAQCF